MNVTKLTIDPDGADVELFDGWQSVYRVRIVARLNRPQFSGCLLAGRLRGAGGIVQFLAPMTVAEELPPEYRVPSNKPMPPDFKIFYLMGAADDDWFRELVGRIVRVYESRKYWPTC